MDGVADIVWTLPGLYRRPLPDDGGVRAAVHVAAAPRRPARPPGTTTRQYAHKEFPGIKALAVNVHDNGYVHTVDKQVKVMADFKGLQACARPRGRPTRCWARSGATPVAMPLPALGDALSKGVVDGYLLPWEVIPSIKAHEFTKYESETDPKYRALYTAVFILAMNQAKYDSLPADLKKVIDANSGAALSKTMGVQWDASAPPARKIAVGSWQYVLHDPVRRACRTGKRPLRNLPDDWVKDVSAKGEDGKALLQAATDLIKKYEK